MSGVRRREFIVLLGGIALARPLPARAQATAIPIIGLLNPGSPASDTERFSGYYGSMFSAFVQRLGERGWIDGRNIVIKYRWGKGRVERYSGIANEFVRLKVNVIVDPAWAFADDL